MDVFIILQFTRSARLRKRFPNFPKMLLHNPCGWFVFFTIKDAIKICFELKSGGKNEKKTTTLQKTQAGQIF